MMRLEVMEGGFPRRIDTTTEGSSLFAFRFRKSSMIFYDPDITRLVQTEPMPKTDFARQIQVSDQNSFGGAVSISAADLVKAFQVFSSYSVGGLDAEVMFNSVKEGTIGEAVQWPDGDLFFYHIHFRKKLFGFMFPGLKAKSSMKDLWYEIYEIKASDAGAVDKEAARGMLKNELQAKLDASNGPAGFDAFVKYYNETFGKATGRRSTRREKRAIKKGEKLDADLRALEIKKDNEKKLLRLSARDAVGDVGAGDVGAAGSSNDADAGSSDGACTGDDAAGSSDDTGTIWHSARSILTFISIILVLPHLFGFELHVLVRRKMPLFVNKSGEDIPSRLNVETDATSGPIEDTPSVPPIEYTPDVLNEYTNIVPNEDTCTSSGSKAKKICALKTWASLGRVDQC